MNVSGWRRIARVTLVLVLAALAIAYVRIVPVTAMLLLVLAGAALARSRYLNLPSSFAALLLGIVAMTIEGAATSAVPQDHIPTLALSLVFLLPALGLAADSDPPPSDASLPVARATLATGRKRRAR